MGVRRRRDGRVLTDPGLRSGRRRSRRHLPSTAVSDDPFYDENAPLRRPAWVTWVALLVIVAMVLTAASALL